MRKYRRMTPTDRTKIEALYNAGHTYRFVAKELGFSVSAIYNEVQHGLYEHMGAETTKRPRHYSAQIAQDWTDYQATVKGVPIKLGHRYDYVAAVSSAILGGMSPDAFVGRMRREGLWTVSTATLYRYIDRGYIPGVTLRDLPGKPHPKRRKRKTSPSARAPKGTSIERRPEAVAARVDFGHWELDSVIGKSSGKNESVLTFIERKTRYQLIAKVPNKTAASTVHALNRFFSQLPQGAIKSITVDNGSEFQDCHGMEYGKGEKRRTTVYYCHPYSSWERGSNERANGIIRRWLPKGQSLSKVTQKDCDRIAQAMNNMPRRILDYATPAELFTAELKNFSQICSFGLDN